MNGKTVDHVAAACPLHAEARHRSFHAISNISIYVLMCRLRHEGIDGFRARKPRALSGNNSGLHCRADKLQGPRGDRQLEECRVALQHHDAVPCAVHTHATYMTLLCTYIRFTFKKKVSTPFLHGDVVVRGQFNVERTVNPWLNPC